MRKYISYLLTLLFSFGIFTSCDKDRNHPGYSYFPDMVQSRAFEPYSENPNFKDGQSLRLPPPGTIPREIIPYHFEKTLEDRALAGRTVFNPDKMKIRDVAAGKKLYKIYCYNCHGLKGNGKGFLFTSGKYPYQPRSLVTDILKNTPRGEIFHVITVGFGVMGAHGPQIKQKDRWKIIEYIKVKLQGHKLGERTLAVAKTSPKESYAEFEARLAKLYSGSKGIGSVKSVKLGTLNLSMAQEGEKIYKQMCTSCHKPTKRYIGPAPLGIFDRRTPEWIMNMILNPNEMVSNDPIAKELLKRYVSPMADQNLTTEEARKVLEYFRTIK
ncbi:c-type cytochrome [Ancylomarina longa]|uniref:Cytochrome c domain-containing protein n=1 Tax=Ancylomarina longa TaxID=2487017 RepID=A0A434AY57_9BACT|nr:c-type cytochrome [Ancylomarina longa]RUT79369.1 hypothetical protein DLK05_03875 [Ancylomarina longa]